MHHGKHVSVIWSPKRGYNMFYIFDDMNARDVLEMSPCRHDVRALVGLTIKLLLEARFLHKKMGFFYIKKNVRTLKFFGYFV